MFWAKNEKLSNTQSWEEIKGWFFVVMFDTKMSHLCSPHKWSLNAIVIPNAKHEGYNAMEAFWGKKKSDMQSFVRFNFSTKIRPLEKIV